MALERFCARASAVSVNSGDLREVTCLVQISGSEEGSDCPPGSRGDVKGHNLVSQNTDAEHVQGS